MRTSKLSQNTARLVAALATSPRKTRSSQRRRLTSDGTTTEAPAATREESVSGTSDDELPPLHTASISTESSMASPSTRKRKRGPDTPTASTNIHAVSQTTIKQPPPPTPPSEPATRTPSVTKARRQPAKRVKAPDGSTAVQPPTGWEETYNLVKAMRQPGGSAYPAVVDTQGCAKLHNVHSSPKDQRFQTLIALMLSSQTKDTVTAAAVARLANELPTGLNLDAILGVEPERLDDMIGKVGFHNTKTKYIKQAAALLRDEWDGDIPDTAEGLMSLPGVGPKMAYLCLSVAWGKDEGIGVDVHVHRITNLWNWHGKKTKNPEETRKSLESWLPKDKWHEINGLLVGLGQTVCLPTGRKCENCALAEKRICPARLVNKGGRKEANVKVEVEGDEVSSTFRVDDTDVTAGEGLDDIEDIGTRKQRLKRR